MQQHKFTRRVTVYSSENTLGDVDRDTLQNIVFPGEKIKF